MKRLFILLVLALTFTGSFISSYASDGSDAFLRFQANAAGKFIATTSDGYEVLELIPAFGRLFASVGQYFKEGNSLYSYYMAELIPVCREGQACPGNYSETSIDFDVRLFSNMSMAGSYWPGETQQRLTLFSGNLMLSNYSGNGDALISKENTMLTRSENLPTIMPYGPEMLAGNGLDPVPSSCTGTWKASVQSEEGKTSIRVYLDPYGTMLLLQETNTDQPPLLLKGGFSLSDGELCYLMSSPSSGQMPYQGCAKLQISAGTLIITPAASGSDGLLLPSGVSEIQYHIAAK